jgi:dihydroxyacetone synthase
MAAFARGTFIPITSSFFMFYLYAAPAVRMGALQQLQVIHAATHDSIGMGEDGPTHQPIELAALFRSMPTLLYFRPADSEETAGAWIAAIEAQNAPSIISTSRHKVPQLKQTRRDGVAKGAYVIQENDDAQLTLIGVGAELSHALDAATILQKSKGIRCRVVSFPCQRLFEGQSLEYKRDTLRRHLGIPAIVVEPYTPNGWERYADAGITVRRFGHSLPGPEAYKYFGFDVDSIVSKVSDYLIRIQEDEAMKREFVDL